MVTAIILAAGKGMRINSVVPKQFIEIYETPILAYTLKTFQQCDIIDEIIIVTSREFADYCGYEIVDKYNITKVQGKIIVGGSERQASVYKGLEQTETEAVVIHDGVRPFVTQKNIYDVVNCLDFNGFGGADASTLAVKPKDTIRTNSQTLDRSNLWVVQTPQAFKTSILKEAHEKAIKDKFLATDDIQLVERIGAKIEIIEGSYKNIKITTEDDLAFAQLQLLKSH